MLPAEGEVAVLASEGLIDVPALVVAYSHGSRVAPHFNKHLDAPQPFLRLSLSEIVAKTAIYSSLDPLLSSVRPFEVLR